MSNLGNRLRKRASDLGLSDAEVARRADLNARRYGFYVTGDREPNYQTLLRICNVLNTSPNYLLGFESESDDEKLTKSKRLRLENRLVATINMLSDSELQLVIEHADLVLKHQK